MIDLVYYYTKTYKFITDNTDVMTAKTDQFVISV